MAAAFQERQQPTKNLHLSPSIPPTQGTYRKNEVKSSVKNINGAKIKKTQSNLSSYLTYTISASPQLLMNNGKPNIIDQLGSKS